MALDEAVKIENYVKYISKISFTIRLIVKNILLTM